MERTMAIAVMAAVIKAVLQGNAEWEHHNVNRE
jgi:hypothetical protein